MDFKSKVILIYGPTASGKSNFAIKLSNKISGEIVNADSIQIYKQLKIISARPDPKKFNNVKHHLYGFYDVKKNFSTGDWLKLAIKKIREIKKRKKIPILVGGTGLYFKALTEGLVKIPKIPVKVRKQVRTFQKKLGQDKFYQKLIKLDPNVKNIIQSSDSQRAIRAFEVKYYTQKSIIHWFENTSSFLKDDEFIRIIIEKPRKELINKIHLRTKKMLKVGAINEVKKFLKLNVINTKSAYKAIGIKEIKLYLEKKINLNELEEMILIKTRQYAKRQTTWYRNQMKKWNVISSSELHNFLKKFKN